MDCVPAGIGSLVTGGPWERFGLYNAYVLLREDGAGMRIPAHAGELVPGSTEDLVAAICGIDPASMLPSAPMTLELDPTYMCASSGCGGYCFSKMYRSVAPRASIDAFQLLGIIEEFAREGGAIVRFDGGGDPLAHPSVRDGSALEITGSLGLKSTILTAGDLLSLANLTAIVDSGCYVRVSLNAGTERTRAQLHGQGSSLRGVIDSITRLAASQERSGTGTPIGATFLVLPENLDEMVTAARLARDSGVAHFSARRALGPVGLRPRFTRVCLSIEKLTTSITEKLTTPSLSTSAVS